MLETISSNVKEKRERENRLKEYLSHSLFNHGLPRESGTNICYINSLLVALRSHYEVFKLLVDSRIHAYYLEFFDESDPLYNLHMLIKSMIGDVNKVSYTTINRREKLIESLRAFSDQSNYMVADQNPIPGGNAQGDPMELLLFVKECLIQSIEAIRTREENLLLIQRREIELCRDMLHVCDELEQLLELDLMPIVSNSNRCVDCSHVSRIAERMFMCLPISREYRSIREAFGDYFAEEEFEKRCDECGNRLGLGKARRGFRLEEFPQKCLAIGLVYNAIQNSQVSQSLRYGLTLEVVE